MRRKLDWKEETVLSILQGNSESNAKCVFFEVLNDEGASCEQVKTYDPPYKLSYPDFEKYQENKLVLLVEVKGYNDWYFNHCNALGMAEYQYKQYIVVQKKESVPVHIVFVMTINNKRLYFWETLNNITGMEYFKETHYSERKHKDITHIFWFANDFRTDIENLGK